MVIHQKYKELKMRRIRTHVSWISLERCAEYLEASRSIQPVNKPIFQEKTTQEVISEGIKIIKEDGFILSRGIDDV